jgi:hypothetical protein
MRCILLKEGSGIKPGTVQSPPLACRLDERVPPGLTYEPDEALTELAVRFFAGHGPASLKDFTRWSTLTVADARTATATAGDRLVTLEVDGQALWFDPAAPKLRRTAPAAYLLPLYDELLLTYPQLNFPAVAGHPLPPDLDLFVGSVILEERNVGTWRRKVTGKRLTIDTDLAPGIAEDHGAPVKSAVDRLAMFLGHPLQPEPA